MNEVEPLAIGRLIIPLGQKHHSVDAAVKERLKPAAAKRVVRSRRRQDGSRGVLVAVPQSQTLTP